MTQQQLSTMLSHPDPRVRQYAIRHSARLIARGEEGEPPRPLDAGDPVPGAQYRGAQEFEEPDLMVVAYWHVFDFPGAGSVALDVCSGRVAHALEVDQDVWYVYHQDLSLLMDLPDLPF